MKEVELVCYTKDDLQFLHELLSDTETKRYFPMLYTTSIEQSLLRLRTRLADQEWGYSNRFAIRDVESQMLVGEVSGRMAYDIPTIMELAIVIHPKFRGQGFAQAGAFEFMRYIVNNRDGITRFRLEISDSNLVSKAVAQKLEFDFVKDKGDNFEYWEKDAR